MLLAEFVAAAAWTCELERCLRPNARAFGDRPERRSGARVRTGRKPRAGEANGGKQGERRRTSGARRPAANWHTKEPGWESEFADEISCSCLSPSSLKLLVGRRVFGQVGRRPRELIKALKLGGIGGSGEHFALQPLLFSLAVHRAAALGLFEVQHN